MNQNLNHPAAVEGHKAGLERERHMTKSLESFPSFLTHRTQMLKRTAEWTTKGQVLLLSALPPPATALRVARPRYWAPPLPIVRLLLQALETQSHMAAPSSGVSSSLPMCSMANVISSVTPRSAVVFRQLRSIHLCSCACVDMNSLTPRVGGCRDLHMRLLFVVAHLTGLMSQNFVRPS